MVALDSCRRQHILFFNVSLVDHNDCKIKTLNNAKQRNMSQGRGPSELQVLFNRVVPKVTSTLEPFTAL